jgi:glycosyltransferase involved in cell wall biosynthesis
VSGQPAIAYDVTHLVSRMVVNAPTGIDRVDLAYGRHFVESGRIACGLHYGGAGPHAWSPKSAQRLLHTVEKHFIEATALSEDPVFSHVSQQITTGAAPEPKEAQLARSKAPSRWTRARFRIVNEKAYRPPVGSIYLNVAQHAFEYPRFFRWLDGRPDMHKVFLVHDFLPLDYREYFTADDARRFEGRVRTIMRHATALIVTTEAVKRRVQDEYAKHGRDIDIHVAPLVSPLATRRPAPMPELAAQPYFVVVGTIEPRKNHLLLLNLWRSLAREYPSPPKLVIVGKRGWENEQVIDMLERCHALRGHVLEVSGLSSAGLSTLLFNARALLMPSFAEGYGLPIVEALTLGVPAILSDIDVFREVSQGIATYLDPLDALGWRNAILSFCAQGEETRMAAVEKTRRFRAPTTREYFESVEAFFSRLPALQ